MSVPGKIFNRVILDRMRQEVDKNTEGWASGISTTSILCWSNSHFKNNHWAVARMEFFTVYEFHWLRKGFWQHCQGSAMASYEALRHTRQVSTEHL